VSRSLLMLKSIKYAMRRETSRFSHGDVLGAPSCFFQPSNFPGTYTLWLRRGLDQHNPPYHLPPILFNTTTTATLNRSSTSKDSPILFKVEWLINSKSAATKFTTPSRMMFPFIFARWIWDRDCCWSHQSRSKGLGDRARSRCVL